MADIKNLIKNLHPLETRILLHYSLKDELTSTRLETELGFKEGHANQAFSWLAGKKLLAETSRTPHTYFELTDYGRKVLRDGFTEERVIEYLRQNGPAKLPEIAQSLGIENKEVGSAFGSLAKDKVVSMNADKKVEFTGVIFPTRLEVARGLLKKASETEGNRLDAADLTKDEIEIMGGLTKKRGVSDTPFRTVERETVSYSLTAAFKEIADALRKAGITGTEVGQLTPSLLSSGEWKNATFRSYNITVPPARKIPGRTNPYVQFLESVKDKLCSLGFQEFDGSLVETEFWNGDALFMPQFHSARDIHDVYRIKNPTHAKFIEEPYFSRVAQVHENGGDTGSRGWSYKFDGEFAKRLILRSQGTVLSAHQLHTAQVPGKYFGVVRCFRYDKVDATHLSDFYQTEGIVLGEDVNLRTLLGFLEMFAVEIAGATEVKYVPGYFPFTEPSVEVHIKHPKLGWFELGGSGIFRPEVTKPMGIDVPVLAWGIGIDRMALMALGLSDLRELFSFDIEKVRLRRADF